MNGTEIFQVRRGLLSVALLACAMTLSVTTAAIDRKTSDAEEPRALIRIVVLPFQNGTGDVAWDDWQQALPGLVRTGLKECTRLDVPGSKQMRRSVERAGWNSKTNRVEAAREIADELKAGIVVWGRYFRQTNGFVAEVSIWQTNSTVRAAKLEVSSSNWVGLAESIVAHTARHVGQALSERELRYWRTSFTESETAIVLLGRAIVLQINEAPRAEQEKVLRELLLTDKRCAHAYTSLRELLGTDNRKDEMDSLAADFLRECPDACDAHLSLAGIRLRNGDNEAAERGMREALRLHTGCPGAVMSLFLLSMKRGEPGDIRKVLEEAHQVRPHELQTRILLSFVRAYDEDIAGARQLLHVIDELPPEDGLLDAILLKASMWTTSFELLGWELLRLGPSAVTNQGLREEMAVITLTNREKSSAASSRITPPQKFTAPELQAELARRLSTEERALVVNPVEVTPELIAEAKRLTAGLPNDSTKIIALFSDVARRGRGRADGGRHTASEALKAARNPQSRFVCQEYAKLFVGLARAAGIDAWLAHIDRDAFGYPGYHDCAAVFVDGEVMLIDPTWRMMGVKHQEFRILDDLQAVSHHMVQVANETSEPRRLRAALKLNPEDRWTRVQFVHGMVRTGEYATAREELRRLQGKPETWDVHVAEAGLHKAQEQWDQSLSALQRALALSPSNAVVHFYMAQVYENRGQTREADEHLELALQLNRGAIPEQSREAAAIRLAVAQVNAPSKPENETSGRALRKRAEAGEVAAQVALAQALFNEAPSKWDEGLDWLRKAAEQGSAIAQFNYALNLVGKHGPNRSPEAIEWLTRAAEQGLDEAQHRLGLILYEGKLAPRDMAAACSWVALAAAQGSKESKTLLKEIELFIRPEDLAEARRRVAAFVPKKTAVK